MSASPLMTAAVLYGARDVRIERRPRPELRAGMVLLRVLRVGMCGSDLHYFHHGQCAGFVPTRPFVLGHELSAQVEAVADDVTDLAAGVRVAVNPARACDRCSYCRSGRRNLCRRTVMLGSASTTPPTDGGFAQWLTVRADQCHVLPEGMDDGVGALLEPFAVALHAVRRAGSLSARRVLVTGGGTIGLLAAMTARALGAGQVVMTDALPERRATGLRLGVEAVLDPADPQVLARAAELSGDGFEVVIEAAGAQAALRQAFDLVRPGGTIVQVGTLGTGDVPLPANKLMTREINLIGSFRYADEFDDAIRLAMGGRVPLQSLVSEIFPLGQATQALGRAAEPGSVTKVQIQVEH